MTEQCPSVLFVCTGNYYRSRFCEHLFNVLAERRQIRWRAASRGLQTWLADGYGPISEMTVQRLKDLGIPINGDARFPLPLTESDLQTAGLVVALKESEHRAMMAEQFPDWTERIEYWHVDDIDCAGPDEALALCEAYLETLIERLAQR
ncbi:MAG: low molecular weight phosphatase family protein [Planctomycetaceae bacterium]|nr:MAG: low molecular weight phosphatase family protein [Planctomycetaceae bacterium]